MIPAYALCILGVPVVLKSVDNFLTGMILRIIPASWQPNHITGARILLIPLVWALYYLVSPWAATGSFAFLAATDFVDGRLARGRGIVTDLGKKLDITCDLALVWSSVILLWREDIIRLEQDSVLFWALAFILIREVLITVIRLQLQVKADKVRVNKMGKCKTAFFMLGLLVLLTSAVWVHGATFGTWLLAAAAICSFISGIQYIQQFSKPNPV